MKITLITRSVGVVHIAVTGIYQNYDCNTILLSGKNDPYSHLSRINRYQLIITVRDKDSDAEDYKLFRTLKQERDRLDKYTIIESFQIEG